MRKFALMLLVCLLAAVAWEPAAAQMFKKESPRKCNIITDPDSFIKSAADKSAVMTIVRATEFGKAAGYTFPLTAAFVLPDENTLITVSQRPTDGKFVECFTSVHEDDDTWKAVQKFFGRGA